MLWGRRAPDLGNVPDAHHGDDRHWTCGDFGVSEWTLTGSTVLGKRIEVRGVDLLEFADGKITRLGGSIVLASSTANAGARFVVTLPS